jgi:hypothetical protein
MSSYRDFARDTAYDYLRIPHDEDRLMFERQPDGDYELVVRKDWPFMVGFVPFFSFYHKFITPDLG